MSWIHTVAGWLSGLFVSAEDQFLSRSVDLADFERRQRIVEQARYRSLYNHMWY